jgi:hypothetical protein
MTKLEKAKKFLNHGYPIVIEVLRPRASYGLLHDVSLTVAEAKELMKDIIEAIEAGQEDGKYPDVVVRAGDHRGKSISLGEWR